MGSLHEYGVNTVLKRDGRGFHDVEVQMPAETGKNHGKLVRYPVSRQKSESAPEYEVLAINCHVQRRILVLRILSFNMCTHGKKQVAFAPRESLLQGQRCNDTRNQFSSFHLTITVEHDTSLHCMLRFP